MPTTQPLSIVDPPQLTAPLRNLSTIFPYITLLHTICIVLINLAARAYLPLKVSTLETCEDFFIFCYPDSKKLSGHLNWCWNLRVHQTDKQKEASRDAKYLSKIHLESAQLFRFSYTFELKKSILPFRHLPLRGTDAQFRHLAWFLYTVVRWVIARSRKIIRPWQAYQLCRRPTIWDDSGRMD